MKQARIFIVMLCLSAGLPLHAADTADAYSDGAQTGKASRGQGTDALKNTDPSGLIPGYTANPPQSGSYGGVQGGDGGISDKGRTEYGNGDAGKAVSDSASKNPPVKIDPDADFIQNGKKAESEAGDRVNGLSPQCTEKVVSKSVFENFGCDRDVNQIQTCARTASIQVTGSKETYTTQLVMDARNSTGNNEADWWIRYDFTVPDDGTLTSGAWEFLYTRAPNYHGDRLGFTMRAFGQSVTTKYNYSGTFSIAPQRVTKGQIVSLWFHYDTDGHYEEGRDGTKSSLANGGLVLRITLPMSAERDTTSSQVVWSESCPFDRSKATGDAGSQCVDPAGSRTINQNGKDYTQYSNCWQYSDAYVVPVSSPGNCATLMNDRNCTQSAHGCTEVWGTACIHESVTFQCQKTYTSSGVLCGGDYFCKTGDCSETDGAGDSGFDTAVAKLAGLASAGDDVKNGDQVNIRAFTGQPMSCRKAVAGFSNCCVDTGWGNSAGLSNCNSEEMAIGKAKAKKVTVSVGEKCDHAVLGVCVQKSQVYCVFGGKLARIIQEQGRRDQLHIGFGSGDAPDCRGITVPELQGINFDKINFQDFYYDLMNNQKIPDADAMAKIAKDRIAAQVNQQTGGRK